jgi:catechol 2,3-dioxygenase-like lactoylglutathione lyase family enzyme
MDWKIEVVTIPVSDVDRARDSYVEKVGFEVDIDHRISNEVRLVQLTPSGSACSIHLGKGTVGTEPGSIDGVFLVVRDVRAARTHLVERGVEVSEFQISTRVRTARPVKGKTSTMSGASSSATRMATAGACSRSPPAISWANSKGAKWRTLKPDTSR